MTEGLMNKVSKDLDVMIIRGGDRRSAAAPGK